MIKPALCHVIKPAFCHVIKPALCHVTQNLYLCSYIAASLSVSTRLVFCGHVILHPVYNFVVRVILIAEVLLSVHVV